ncbi:hypothetical protein QAD02_018703 [Eretmocerus hayati]|uniref:Uncharacterized protein n=1 Tax=Eretmocerus hayati TaxID=131215 RepID=A0ACC2PHJ2_9HYME|nr:hypothetical protein QAD02_018703 [Eretmocerus hayati]
MARILILALAISAVFCEEITPEDNPTTLPSNDVQNVTEADYSESNREKRIYNGQPVSIGRHPWMAALLLRNKKFNCGGSVITPMLILTAQHCISPNPPAFVRVNSNDWNDGGELHQVNPGGVHAFPNDDNYWLHDIAVVALRTRIRYPHMVTLGSPQYYPPAGAALQVAGWGLTPQGWPRLLHETSIYTMDMKSCYSYGYTLPQSKAFCTHTYHSSICRGDSGSAVMYKGVQIGVVSHLNKPNMDAQYTCFSRSPDTMAFVPAYLNWIRPYMRKYR